MEGAGYGDPLAGEESDLARQAALESLLHIAATSRASSIEMEPVVDEAAAVVLSPQSLPGLGEAFQWFLGAFR